MSSSEGRGTGGQTQAMEWRPRTSAAFEPEAAEVPAVQGVPVQRPIPQPRQVRQGDHQERRPQQQPVPVVQLAPAAQHVQQMQFAPAAQHVLQQQMNPAPVPVAMQPPPYPGHGSGIQQQTQLHVAYPFQPQSHAAYPGQPQVPGAAAPAGEPMEKAANQKTNYKLQCKVNARFCGNWRGILEIIARSGAIVSL